MKQLFTVLTLLALTVGSNAFAALSAVVTMSPNPARINQLVTASIAIQNTGAATTLTNLNITAAYSQNALSRIPAAYSQFNLGPNSPYLGLAANATTIVPMQVVFFSPSTGITGSGTGQYMVGANFTTSDGTVTSAAYSGPVTVNPLPLPLSQQ